MNARVSSLIVCSFLSVVFALPIVRVDFNNSNNFSFHNISMLGGCLGTYFGCCDDNVSFCMNMNCTNCMNSTVY